MILTVLALVPPAFVAGAGVASVISRARANRERRTDRLRREAADKFARDAAEVSAVAAHQRNVAASKAARHIESVEEWFARTGAQPTRKERA